jgi:hypothetical protein
MNLLPNTTVLALMRSQSNALMSTPVEVYNVTITYNTYGQQVVSSGLVFAVSGYVGAVRGKDEEYLVSKGYTGIGTEQHVTVLVPFGNTITINQIVRTNNKDFRVVWTNDYTQDSIQLYTKALCALFNVESEKRRLTNG